MFKLLNVSTNIDEEKFITPTVNVIPPVTIPPFLNLITNLNVQQTSNETIIKSCIILDGIIVSGNLLTLTDYAVNLENATILYGIVNSDKLITNVKIVTVDGRIFNNLTISDAIINNAILNEVVI